EITPPRLASCFARCEPTLPLQGGGKKAKMPADLHFILTLALRMAVAAAFVVTTSIIAERAGAVIGGLIGARPVSAGPSYVFLALDHDAAFIGESALASFPINAVTMFYCLTYVVLAQRNGAV